jgi:hypothetical protein
MQTTIAIEKGCGRMPPLIATTPSLRATGTAPRATIAKRRN